MSAVARFSRVHREHHYSLSMKEGWFQRVADDERPRERPPQLTRGELGRLRPADQARYNEWRRVWHANLGPYFTPQMVTVLEELDEIVEANRQDGDRLRSAPVLDAPAGLGKTTLAIAYGARFHKRQIQLYGPTTPGGHQRIPVIYLPLMSATTIRSVSSLVCRFMALPSADHGTAIHLANRGADAILACETRLMIVDEANFIDMERHDGRDIANHFKWLQDQFPVTFFFVGVGLRERHLFTEGEGDASRELAQNWRRWTRLTLEPFEVRTAIGRSAWRRLLKAIERDIVLADKYPGMLANDLADYCFARSTGHFASLMTLIARGCYRAIATGQERLTVDLLNGVRRIDEAAETTRSELEAAFKNGLLSTHVAIAKRAT